MFAAIAAVKKPRSGFPLNMEVVERRWTAIIVERTGLNPDSLTARGINVTHLAMCLDNDLVDAGGIPATIERLDVETFNISLAHLVDRIPALHAHPTSLLEQRLHMHEIGSHQGCDGHRLCSCDVDYNA